ncbi:ATP-dependent zinc metalloprotease FtsH [Mycoplasma suis]|uniref:ATP-dependent zinc metalloprotease FtsH n=2 Tax=Mycoplasma suis TaxID=57372 RepID=F0QSC0_MYCSL|nr:ATP-dependent zinc metalloprotease FtsH [Mycoplasma suis]ADX98390.1 cell division protein FtsH [Mycoplasma suis str. Illinois]CBZ40899.1 Cell division protease ftsH-like protein [Mycoplasma suis KI3806]
MFFLKLLYWFNFFPKLLFEDDDDYYEGDTDDFDSSSSSKFKKFKGSLSSGGINPKKKSKFMKFFFIAIAILFFYFVFWHSNDTPLKKVDLCKGGCQNGDFKLGDHSIETDFSENAWSEQLSRPSGSESVFKIFVKKKDSSKSISFNVTRRVNDSKESNGNGKTYTFFNSSGKPCIIGTKDDKTLSCCKADGQQCDCCKNGGCTECCKEGKCCGTDGKNCCCCCFIQLIEAAILNPQDPNRLTAGRVFISLLPTLLYLLIFIALARGASKGSFGLYGGKGSIFGIGKSISKRNKSNITFKDVAGIKEEKEELEEIVDFLKRPKKYASMGARIPKGVILYGPPGTGKTLLAKAVSGESNVPFLEASGASFDDMFVGVGAKRVRELFEKAKKLSPCIIFIDEIDALAGKRGGKFNLQQGNEQTINQLLSEMDGFNTQAGIIVIAATNRLESIDDAVLRPGRFDRHIQIDLPDIAERREILKLHAKNKNLSNRVNLEEIARKTPGFSGAQLENVLNEAALLTVRFNKKTISTSEIDEAIDRVMAGPAKKGRKAMFSERKQIAYHEAGHAIAGIYTDDGELVEKITIIPRGRAAGYVLSVPKVQERTISTKKQLKSTILTLLAGRAAEEIFFGVDNISTGAANDLYKATSIARNIVLKFGMTQSAGMTQFIPSEEAENPYKNNYSENYAQIIDEEINNILKEQYEAAKELVKRNKIEFLLIVETLLLLETIDRSQIEYIHKYRKIPREAELERAKIEKREGKKISEAMPL